MATAYTSLLGLALPVTGELSGSWGDTVNDAITSLLDTAISGTTTLSSDADVTLTTSTGVANQARQAILLWTAGGTVTRNITAPAQSKAYFVVNKTSSTQSIVIRGAGPTTGVTVLAGTQSLVVWNGVDFVEVASGNVDGPASATDNAVARFDGTTGKLIQNSVVTIADSTGNMAGVGTLGVGAITTSGALTYGGVTLSNSVTGTGSMVLSASPTLTGTLAAAAANFSGAVALGDAAADNITVNGTVTSNLIFTDNTYDIGASGATRPRNLFLAGNATVGGDIVLTGSLDLTNLEVTNIKAKDGTAGMQIADSTGVVSFTANPVLSGGTANGVTYLNGSKVLTSGSALTFDGTRLTVKGGNANSLFVDNGGQQYTEIDIANNGTIKSSIYWDNTNTNLAYGSTGSATYTAATSTYHAWYISSEQMRLTSTGLGIGTSSPGAKLTVAGIAELIRMANATPYLSFYNAAQSTRFGYIQHNGTNLALVNEQAGALEMYTSNTLRATLDSSGNLGIGTSSPTVKLDVVGTSATEQFRIGNTTGGTDFGITVTENASTIINSAEGATGRGIQFQSGGTNTVLIDSSGNVGIGTSSPDANLTVNGAASFAAGTAAAPSIARAGDLNTGIFFPAADTIAFSEGGAESMRIDSSGNLGLGVTPSAWRTSEYKAIQVGIGASFYGRVTAGDEDKAGFSANAFFDQTDSRWEYIATDSASRYDQIGGGHFWFTAPSGTAGNAITFTQAMALDASGNLGLNVTPSAWTIGKALQVNGASILSTGTEMYLSANAFYGASAWTYRQTDFAAQYYQLNGAHVWRTAPSGTAGNAITFTQAMTLDASGNLGIGTTSPDAKLEVTEAGSGLRELVRFTARDGATNHRLQIGVNDTDNLVQLASTGTSGGGFTFLTGATERARIDSSGNLLVTGAGGLGYGTGSGGAVTQATSRTTGVTLNKTNGAITLVSAAGLATFQSFTVTNSTVAATDVVSVVQKSGTDLYQIFVTAVAAGSFRITFATTGGTTTEQPVFNFAVFKAVIA